MIDGAPLSAPIPGNIIKWGRCMRVRTARWVVLATALTTLLGSPALAVEPPSSGNVGGEASVNGATAVSADPNPVGVASDGTPIWASEADVQAPPGVPGEGSPSDVIGRDANLLAPLCDPGSVVSITGNIANTFDVHYNTSVENRTNRDAEYTVTAGTIDTTTFGGSINIEEELGNKLFAKIKASVNFHASKSMSTSFSDSIKATVEAHTTLRAQNGAWREVVLFESYYQRSNCSVTKRQSGTAWAPYETRWRLFYGS